MSKFKAVEGYAVVLEDGSVMFDSRCKTQEAATSMCHGNSKVVRVKITENKVRSMSANALLHVWTDGLAGFMGETPANAKQILKIRFGFDVLRQDEEKGKKLDWILERYGFYNLTWEQQISLAEWIPCTRMMSDAEMKHYLDIIQGFARDEFGIEMTNKKRG